jgi:hypothetical protein
MRTLTDLELEAVAGGFTLSVNFLGTNSTASAGTGNSHVVSGGNPSSTTATGTNTGAEAGSVAIGSVGVSTATITF